MRLRGGEAGNLAAAHPPARGVQDEQSLERIDHLVGDEASRTVTSAPRRAGVGNLA